jgi:glycosidase
MKPHMHKHLRHKRLKFILSLCLAVFFVLGAPGCFSGDGSMADLGGTWLFKVDSLNAGVADKWFLPVHDRSDWREVEIPAFWSRYDLATYDGVGWYARSIDVDTAQRLALFFGGVDDDAEVWVNGKHAGSHAGYSEAFFIDITDVVKPGRNEIVVQVRDYSGPGGIYKPVKVIPLSRVDELFRSEFASRKARSSADWVKDAIVYEVFLRSFSKDQSFKSLERRIPELKKMGVTVLWLMPIHPIGDANRKGTMGSPYSVQDFYGIDPDFGTLDDFRSLVQTVHDHGLKIIIDLVANHAAWDSKLMFEHSDWFTTDETGAIVSPNADWSDVADLNYDHHELRKYMIAMMKYWVQEVGIDGYRCDVAELVPTEFWEVARRELDEVKPVLMLSEGTVPEHHLEAFDITYSWSTYDVLDRIFNGTTPASVFNDILRNESYQFPRGSLRLRFNTNHDKNAWDAPAVKKFGKDGAAASAVLMMTLPGVPLIYNGEEVGNDRALSLFEKVDIDWEKNRDMRSFYEALCSLRNSHIALRGGDYRSVANSDSSKVLSFLRVSGSDKVLTVLNFSKDKKTVSVFLPPGLNERWADYFTQRPALMKNTTMDITLPGRGYRIFVAGK